MKSVEVQIGEIFESISSRIQRAMCIVCIKHCGSSEWVCVLAIQVEYIIVVILPYGGYGPLGNLQVGIGRIKGLLFTG
jgi:hypothetical protein